MTAKKRVKSIQKRLENYQNYRNDSNEVLFPTGNISLFEWLRVIEYQCDNLKTCSSAEFSYRLDVHHTCISSIRERMEKLESLVSSFKDTVES